MRKPQTTVIVVLAMVLTLNIVALVRIGGPLFSTLAEGVPVEIPCQGCEPLKAKAALAQEVSAREAAVRRHLNEAVWWAFGLVVVNLAGFIIAGRIHRGKGGSLGSTGMASAIPWFLFAITSYAVAWTVAYVFVMGADFSYFFQYLRYAWTGGGERPMAIGFISLGIFAVTLVAAILVRRVFAKRRTGAT